MLGKNPTTVLFGTIRCLCSSVTLGKATVLQPRPSSSSTSLTVTALHRTLNSVIGWKRLRIGGSPVMHIKTTKCNRFCLVASVTSRELFHHSEVQVTVRCHSRISWNLTSEAADPVFIHLYWLPGSTSSFQLHFVLTVYRFYVQLII